MTWGDKNMVIPAGSWREFSIPDLIGHPGKKNTGCPTESFGHDRKKGCKKSVGLAWRAAFTDSSRPVWQSLILDL